MSRRGLSRRERASIDLALLDIYRAGWEAEREVDPPLMRAAYIQGRVDQRLGRAPVRPDEVSTTTERRLI